MGDALGFREGTLWLSNHSCVATDPYCNTFLAVRKEWRRKVCSIMLPFGKVIFTLG
jgi:hypothetical protein